MHRLKSLYIGAPITTTNAIFSACSAFFLYKFVFPKIATIDEYQSIYCGVNLIGFGIKAPLIADLFLEGVYVSSDDAYCLLWLEPSSPGAVHPH